MSSVIVPGDPEVFRSFWHGPQLGPYELLAMWSVVSRGHRFELFTYDPAIAVPDWVTRRNAGEILPANHVKTYRLGTGAGSPALHANIFRYELMHQLGGWWLDMDVLLLKSDPPPSETFFAVDARGEVIIGILRFPAGHPVLADLIEACRGFEEEMTSWGQTGGLLITPLLEARGLLAEARPMKSVYPLNYNEMRMAFDPDSCEEVASRAKQATFMHLFNEHRRAAGVSRLAGPPVGSYLDRLFEESGLGIRFPYRLALPELQWSLQNRIDADTYKTLLERTEAERDEEMAQRSRLQNEVNLRIEERDAAWTERDAALLQLKRARATQEASLLRLVARRLWRALRWKTAL